MEEQDFLRAVRMNPTMIDVKFVHRILQTWTSYGSGLPNLALLLVLASGLRQYLIDPPHCSTSFISWLKGSRADTHEQTRSLVLRSFYTNYHKEQTKGVINSITDSSFFGNWAHVSAYAVHLAEMRIVGRQPHSIERIKEDLKDRFNYISQNISSVAPFIQENYGIRVQRRTPEEMKQAVTNGRCCVCTFDLTHAQLENYRRFFTNEETKRKVLTESDLNSGITGNPSEQQRSAHTVIITEYNEFTGCVRFMSSMGKSWGNDGVFTIESIDLLENAIFFDFFWYLSDLSDNEKELWKLESDMVYEKLGYIMRHLEYALSVNTTLAAKVNETGIYEDPDPDVQILCDKVEKEIRDIMVSGSRKQKLFQTKFSNINDRTY